VLPIAAGADCVGCQQCGTRQRLPHLAGNGVLACVTCGSPVERSGGQSLTAALACSAATLLLLLPANLQVLLTSNALGVSRHSVLASTGTSLLTNGWPMLALVVLLCVVVFPLARFALLTTVMGSLYFDRPLFTHPHPGLGRMFRWANTLETWAMVDVFLLAFGVAYARLESAISIHLGIGAMAMIAAAVLSLFTRAVLDKAAVWRAIAPDTPPSDVLTAVACMHCELLVAEERTGMPCPRCAAPLRKREPASISITLALTVAALLLYIPANIYPLATLPIHFRPTSYTVLQGVIDLFDAGFYVLGSLVFTASFAIPVLKLIGLGWCVHSVVFRSRRYLVTKTKVYRIVEEIGRWSMVDPFVIGCAAPVLDYSELLHGGAGPAALPFTIVVVLTIVSAKVFDPRLMWDAARSKQ
jgi:paraquat-inducible protein A